MPDGIFGCWVWTAHTSEEGYGKIKSGAYKSNEVFTASRISHEIYKGVVPPELQIDHLCRKPSCVNPFCLEIVTPSINCLRRPNRFGDFCINGHERTDENVYLTKKNQRHCKVCQDIRQKERRAKEPKVGRGSWQKVKTHCKYGHEFTEENTLNRPNGCRECRTCKQDYLDKEKAARKAAREERKLLSLN